MSNHKTIFGALRTPGCDARDEDARRKAGLEAKVAKVVGAAAEESGKKKPK